MTKPAYTGPRRTAPENSVRRPDVRIVTLLMQLAGHYRKHYCHPTQEKLIELVRRFTGLALSRRQLNRHLNALQDQGYLHRTRRHEHVKRRGFVMRSTLYRIGGRFLQQLKAAHVGLGRFRESLEKSASSIRVPGAAQYARNLLKVLVPAGGYPQARAPSG